MLHGTYVTITSGPTEVIHSFSRRKLWWHTLARSPGTIKGAQDLMDSEKEWLLLFSHSSLFLLCTLCLELCVSEAARSGSAVHCLVLKGKFEVPKERQRYLIQCEKMSCFHESAALHCRSCAVCMLSCEHAVPSAATSSAGPKPMQLFGHLSEISYSLQISLRGVS